MQAQQAGTEAAVRMAGAGERKRTEGGVGAQDGVDEGVPAVVHHGGKRGLAGGVPRLEAAGVSGCGETDGAAGRGDAGAGEGADRRGEAWLARKRP